MGEQVLDQIYAIILELSGDRSIPKNVISKLDSMKAVLQQEGEDLRIKVDKALQIVDEIMDDTNLQPFIRTKLWNISSILESA